MLSKVLRRADSADLPLVAFPHIRDYPDASRSLRATPAAPSGDRADLLEKIRVLEARTTSEARAAFEAGRREAENSARAELEPIAQRLATSTAETLAMRSELRRRAEVDVVQLALMIARRVLHRQLMVDESALTALARVAFERLARGESYRVTVNPQFAGAISAALPASQSIRVQIDPDPGCAPGTLVIHSSDGTIDASIDTQLEEIGRGLTDRLKTI